MRRRSSHDFEYAIPAHRDRPAPDHPGVLALGDRKENYLGAADEILQRHIAEHTAVAGVIAVVAHHEEIAWRHLVYFGCVGKVGAVDAIERFVSDTVGQGFLPALYPRHRFRSATGIFTDKVAHAFALHRLIVDVKQPLLHLDAIAGQPDHAFDEIGRDIVRRTKLHDVAAGGLRTEDAARKQRRRKRERILAVAGGKFREKKKDAD